MLGSIIAFIIININKK